MPWLLLLLACTCAPPDPPPPPPERGHFDEWDRLVRAAAAGDVETARIVAGDLTEGDVIDHDGAARVGGAKGFLHVATDEDDVIDAVVAAAAGCGACHADLQVEPPPLSPWRHHDAARRAAASLVWRHAPAAEEPPPADAPLDAVRDAWTGAADPEARVAAALRACIACHDAQEGAPPPAPADP